MNLKEALKIAELGDIWDLEPSEQMECCELLLDEIKSLNCQLEQAKADHQRRTGYDVLWLYHQSAMDEILKRAYESKTENH